MTTLKAGGSAVIAGVEGIGRPAVDGMGYPAPRWPDVPAAAPGHEYYRAAVRAYWHARAGGIRLWGWLRGCERTVGPDAERWRCHERRVWPISGCRRTAPPWVFVCWAGGG